MKTSGMKTAAREIVIARIVKLISPADFSVASRADCPSSISRHRILEEDDGIVESTMPSSSSRIRCG